MTAFGPLPIEVFRVPLSKAQLQTMPAEDRNLLLLAGHASNQLSFHLKLLLMSTNRVTGIEPEDKLSAAQTQMILRSMIGALVESWELTKKYGRLIGTGYLGGPEFTGQAVYSRLKNHFGQSGLLHNLRNTVSYHHPKPAEMEAAFEHAPEYEDWSCYVSEANTNTFYFLSDVVISTALLRETGEADQAIAFGKVMKEVNLVTDAMHEFFGSLMRAIVTRHLGAKALDPLQRGGQLVAPEGALAETFIPFFSAKYVLSPLWCMGGVTNGWVGIRRSKTGIVGL